MYKLAATQLNRPELILQDIQVHTKNVHVHTS